MPDEYISIKNSVTAEIIEKKSRFIAASGIVENETAARGFIEEIKTRFKEASHYTYAFVVGETVRIARYSDDGEPHGTAGLPILDIIQGKNLTNTIIVVVRYFGGTKLGTGGLVRAYSKSAADCIETAGSVRYIPGIILKITTDYHHLGKIKNHLEKNGHEILNEEYAGHVIILTLVRVSEIDSLTVKIMDLTNASAIVDKAGERYIKTEG